MDTTNTSAIAGKLLETLADEPALQHELTFYASFAHKTFALMQREGPEKQGFIQLQQSFREAVEKVRAILDAANERGFSSKGFLEMSPAGMANFMSLIGELARIKQRDLSS